MAQGKTVVIIQARYGSTRLPGKILEKIGRQSALEHTLRRCQNIQGIDEICCAIPDTVQDNLIAQEAMRCGATIVRGPQEDVLKRYRMAADATHAKTIIRVTSDCPLCDASVISQTLKLYHKTGADFACNNAPPTWPHGLDCEITSFDWLKRADDEAIEPYHREHVMPYIRTHPHIKLVNYLGSDPRLKKHRWTLDYKEDLDFFRALEKVTPDLIQATSAEIRELLEKHPQISKINEQHHDKSR